jgi:chemotaxis protein methyltransferase CheR
MSMKQDEPQSTSTQPTIGGLHRRPMLLTSEQFSQMRDLLAQFSGVYLDSARQRVLEQGVMQRLQATNTDLESYTRLLQNSTTELHQLAELVVNHETFFFRNMPHIQALRDVLLPELHQRKPVGETLRIWSAGCSTGEEAYSLAILVLETLSRPFTRPVEIIATDLSEAALRKARAGVYRGRALGNLPADLLARYFQRQGDSYVVNDRVRSLVRFETLNLLEAFPPYVQKSDIIFCQNVTIYFQLETCRKLIERFYECLPENGLLFLGFSETLWNVFDRLRSREVAGSYVYYKESKKDAQKRETRQARARALEKQASRVNTATPTKTTGSSVAGKGEQKPRSRSSRTEYREAYERSASHQAQLAADRAALQRGRELLEVGQATEALEALSQVSPQSIYACAALTLTARAHADRGELDTAVAELHRALEIDSLNEEAYSLLGLIYSRQEQWLSAAHQFERARYLRPDLALISFYLAEAYRNLGRLNLAAREYRNTLQKLDGRPPGALIDGVAIGWLRETCQRHLEYLPQVP